MKLKLSYISLLALVLGVSSCSDSFLDQEPDERVKITNEKQVAQLLATAYPEGDYGWMCEISTDNYIDNNCPHLPSKPNVDQIEDHYNLSAYSGTMDDELFRFEPVKSYTGKDSPSSVWLYCYAAIAVANQALEHIEELVAQNGGEYTNSLRRSRAEALLCRAYSHFLLVNLFSQTWKDDELSKKDIGIPYVTKPETTVKPMYDRSNVYETYQLIEKDMLEGLKDVGDETYEMPKWHFNTKAAHAFAARFYLYKREWAKVVEHADIVLGKDSLETAQQLQRYDGFDNCTSSEDYAVQWQSSSNPNNLMLMVTYSLRWRRLAGYRYACAGLAIQAINYHTGPNWSWYRIPSAAVSGASYYRSKADYGYMWAKCAERFEYTNKVAGTGQAHAIRREFTATELLLSRAEAKLMLGDKEGCLKDLFTYDASRWTFSDANTKFYRNNNSLKDLTLTLLENYYKPQNVMHFNCFQNWDFTQQISPSYVVTADQVTCMNAINDMRRYETAYDGQRFFDMRRWGMEVTHEVGLNKEKITVSATDPRRAFELPAEVIAAGLEPTRPHDSSQDKQLMDYDRAY